MIAAEPEVWDGKIVQYGKMREAIGQQQHQGRVELKKVVERPHFYGVAALAKLAGEATILDSQATVTRVTAQGGLEPAEAPLAEQATLLVGAYVPNWTEHKAGTNVAPDALEQFLEEAAGQAGIETSRPFVFALEGDFSNLHLHVINGACPMHARLKNITLPKEQQPFEVALDKVAGAVFGVFAKDAVGDLTHPATSTHMHLVFKDEQTGEMITGHVEELGLLQGAVLKLPKTR
jgi:alpha-acetolactate decarboxylase